MQRGQKTLTYLNRVKILAATLEPMSLDIDDQELDILALDGHLSYYEFLIIALNFLEKDNRSFSIDFDQIRLLQEEQRASRHHAFVSESKPSAVVGIPSKIRNGSCSGFKLLHKYSNHSCEYCKFIGHSASVWCC